MLSLLERCFKDAFFCDFHHLAPRAAHSPFLASSVLLRLKSVIREMEMHGKLYFVGSVSLLDFPFRFEVESCFVGESEMDYPAMKKSLSENHSRNCSFELFDESKWIILP